MIFKDKLNQDLEEGDWIAYAVVKDSGAILRLGTILKFNHEKQCMQVKEDDTGLISNISNFKNVLRYNFFRAAKPGSIHPSYYWNVEVKKGESIKKGDIVTIDSNGKAKSITG